MNRRPPEKRPHRCCRAEQPAPTPSSNDDTAGYSAPSHMGGQFEESGYKPDPYQCNVCLEWFPVRCMARDCETRHDEETRPCSDSQPTSSAD